MNVYYTERVKQESEGYALLQQLSKELEAVMGPRAVQVTAEWDRTEDDKGQTLYRLGITDWSDAARTSFTADELRSKMNMPYRLHRFYDDLLKAKNHRQLQNLFALDEAEK